LFSTFVSRLPSFVRCSALACVNLSGNSIGDVGMAQLADALEVRVVFFAFIVDACSVWVFSMGRECDVLEGRACGDGN
jgi:hypothetical protein